MRKIIVTFLAVSFLASCSGGEVKRSLGISKKSPDEFMVISRPPLSVPPDFSLRAPQDVYEQNGNDITQDAKSAVFNSGASSSDNIFNTKNKRAGKTSADAKLLEKVGADAGNSSIRQVLEQESQVKESEEEEKGYFESMFDSIQSSDEPVVDASKEKERLEENDKADLPPTSGETPTKKVKKSVF